MYILDQVCVFSITRFETPNAQIKQTKLSEI